MGEPVWTPYNRDEIDEKRNASRLKYVNSFLNPLKASRLAVEADVSLVAGVDEVSAGRSAAAHSVEAWYMDGSDADQREPHTGETPEMVPQSKLNDLGLLSWSGISGPGTEHQHQ